MGPIIMMMSAWVTTGGPWTWRNRESIGSSTKGDQEGDGVRVE